jgi:hypothetical protein
MSHNFHSIITALFFLFASQLQGSWVHLNKTTKHRMLSFAAFLAASSIFQPVAHGHADLPDSLGEGRLGRALLDALQFFFWASNSYSANSQTLSAR